MRRKAATGTICAACGSPAALFEDLPGYRHWRTDEVGREVPYDPGHFPVLPAGAGDLTRPCRRRCSRCRLRRAARGDWCLKCWGRLVRTGMRRRGIPVR